MDHLNKLEALKENISKEKNILIAFSGGIDSALLLKVARDVLGKGAFCVILDAKTVPRSEIKDAESFVKNLQVGYDIVKFPILKDKDFIKNSFNRCYLCKKSSSGILKKIALEKGIKRVADGVNLSDLSKYRPGIKASEEEGIWHPFVDLEIEKADIRRISKEIGIPFWDKPSSACLVSRIPYGEEITREKLRMIEKAEEFLKEEGFEVVRVRMYGRMARIEILKDDFDAFFRAKEEIAKELKRIGFKYVTLDLEGYRSGSMDKALL
ncbi:MAG: ATP-dependent sacrificial sulfur transferase LarE [Candidatus Methanolliviera hydrocarbonicum]|uniref:ATP-dependent sacrificial sulfur transferase LarE n=1 Tax=Candidatus Methanolliviera hydrocarbonicum TaxID=2491085 RepID=A0A520KUJ1_9EURY|nr:MAG: ATP-dependent sacrificial sulfur transferase LarE [Candidatus Methanolliviera hydrocarbonicum]